MRFLFHDTEAPEPSEPETEPTEPETLLPETLEIYMEETQVSLGDIIHFHVKGELSEELHFQWQRSPDGECWEEMQEHHPPRQRIGAEQ